MTDKDALIAGIVAAPDDDAPKLVYADWLEENGETASAKAIREVLNDASEWPRSLIKVRRVIRGLLESGLPQAMCLKLAELDVVRPAGILLLAYADVLEEFAERSEGGGLAEAESIRQFCGIGMGLDNEEVNRRLADAGLKCRLPRRDGFYGSFGVVGNSDRLRLAETWPGSAMQISMVPWSDAR